MNDTAVFSVVYAGVERFLPEFLSSLAKQTARGFTLFLINDGVQGLENFLHLSDVNAEILKKTAEPAALRKMGIAAMASRGIKRVIFADADDYLAENRIDVAGTLLEQWDIVCNEFIAIGEDVNIPAPMLGHRLANLENIRNETILNGNCLGLSNTAAWIDRILPFAGKVPNSTVAFDWDLFGLCLQGGLKAAFTDQTHTFYRQHANNIVGRMILSESLILRGVEVKKNHYRLMAKYYEEYEPKAKAFESIWHRMTSDKKFLKDYCAAVSGQAEGASFWWEPMKTTEDLGI